MRLLITEDDKRVASLVEQGLREEGYEVDVVRSGESAIDSVREAAYDLVLLDVMLPRLDGFATCRRIRELGASMPVLMLTARDEVDDRVRGLDAGADDYLSKPFSLAELLARVRALLRRGPGEFGSRVAVGDLVLDTSEETLRSGEAEVQLSHRECAVLEVLIRTPDRVVERETIVRQAWPGDPEHQSNVLEVLIKRVRAKLESAGAGAAIETVRGVGYRLRSS